MHKHVEFMLKAKSVLQTPNNDYFIIAKKHIKQHLVFAELVYLTLAYKSNNIKQKRICL